MKDKSSFSEEKEAKRLLVLGDGAGSTRRHPGTGAAAASESNPLEILWIFLRLGCTSFGGPAAHLGYFRAAFVERRQWLTERAYADLLALCQFLPGPASSQTGFAIGLLRGGLPGGLAAWVGFTAPSALLMSAFAYGAEDLAGSHAGAGLLHGLKLMAVAIVAQAVIGMARTLCPDRTRTAIAAAILIKTWLGTGPLSQVGSIAAGALAGWILCGRDSNPASDDIPVPVSRRLGVACLAAFFGILGLTFIRATGSVPALFGAFYRTGALVFGGGHVVLPLLQDAVVRPGWVSQGTFLAGYGAAQAMPGPLFTLAAYLGAAAGGAGGALIALAGIFLPGILCLLGVLPFWHALRANPGAQAAMRGTNAAVVGLLAATLAGPVWHGAVHTPADIAASASGFALLMVWRVPPLLVAGVLAVTGIWLDAASP